MISKSLFQILFLGNILIYSSSCNNINSKNEYNANMSLEHTSQLSLDWQGTYSGELPCANCDKIEVSLTLNADLTYLLINKWYKNETKSYDTTKGSFKWEANNIILNGLAVNNQPNIYKVEENGIRQLDLDGNRVSGSLSEMYLLKKNGNALVENIRWKLIELNGEPIEGNADTHFIVFHSEENKLEAKANCNVLLFSYRIKNQVQLSIEDGISTKMACPNNLEQKLIESLKMADNLTTDGAFLSINKGKMAALVRFEKVQ